MPNSSFSSDYSCNTFQNHRIISRPRTVEHASKSPRQSLKVANLASERYISVVCRTAGQLKVSFCLAKPLNPWKILKALNDINGCIMPDEISPTEVWLSCLVQQCCNTLHTSLSRTVLTKLKRWLMTPSRRPKKEQVAQIRMPAAWKSRTRWLGCSLAEEERPSRTGTSERSHAMSYKVSLSIRWCIGIVNDVRTHQNQEFVVEKNVQQFKCDILQSRKA